jgi:hypothetical protein
MNPKETTPEVKLFKCPECGRKMPDASKHLHDKYCTGPKSEEENGGEQEGGDSQKEGVQTPSTS